MSFLMRAPILSVNFLDLTFFYWAIFVNFRNEFYKYFVDICAKYFKTKKHLMKYKNGEYLRLSQCEMRATKYFRDPLYNFTYKLI